VDWRGAYGATADHVKPWPELVDQETLRRVVNWQALQAEPKKQALELDLCRQDIHRWLRNWVWLLDPKTDDPRFRRIPLIPWPQQTVLVDFLMDGIALGRPRQVNKSREIGVSWLSLAVITWHWLFQDAFLAKVGSRKEEFACGETPDSLMGKVLSIIDNLPVWMKPELTRKERTASRLVNPDNRSEILAESTNRNFGRGGRRTVVLIDESAHVEPRLQNTVALALETVALSTWSVSTPNGTGNRFHTDWQSLPEEDRLEIDWRADPRRTEAWFEGHLRENGGKLSWDEREQEYNCSFAAVSGLRIYRIGQEVERMSSEIPRDSRYSRPIAGMDFGSGPSYTVWGCGVVEYDQETELWSRIWIDRVLYWSRTAAEIIAGDMIGSSESLYARRIPTFGDPAGIAAESDQESWQTKIQRAGAPLQCLPAEYNSREFIDSGIQLVQDLTEAGQLLFNADDPGVQRLLVDLRAWEWNLPPGILLEAVNRAYIEPKKDGHSHGCDKLRYLVQAAVNLMPRLTHKTKPDPNRRREEETTVGHQYGNLQDAL